MIFCSTFGAGTADGRLQHPGHVRAQHAHDLQTLGILPYVFDASAVHHGPVVGRYHRHAVDLEILVDLVDGGRSAGAARGGDGGSGLEAQPCRGGVEQAVEHGQQGAVRSRVEHRRADDEAVGFHCLLDEPVRHVVVEDAAVVAALGATAAAQAAANGVAPDPGDLGVDALRFQRAGYFGQRGVGAALLVRTPVDQQNFHEPRLVSRLASFAREPG